MLSIFLRRISTDRIIAAREPTITMAASMIKAFAGLYLNLPSHSYVRTNADTTITTENIISRLSIFVPSFALYGYPIVLISFIFDRDVA